MRTLVDWWADSCPALIAAIDLLPTIEDDTTADVLELLATTIVAKEEENRALRIVQSKTLTLWHADRLELSRIRQQRDRLLAERRAAPTPERAA